MTTSILEYYKTRQQLVLNETYEMHEHSNWTQEMVEKEEFLNKKYYWLRNRIENIEEMICYNDGDGMWNHPNCQ